MTAIFERYKSVFSLICLFLHLVGRRTCIDNNLESDLRDKVDLSQGYVWNENLPRIYRKMKLRSLS